VSVTLAVGVYAMAVKGGSRPIADGAMVFDEALSKAACHR
jgi:hypothetical protein